MYTPGYYTTQWIVRPDDTFTIGTNRTGHWSQSGTTYTFAYPPAYRGQLCTYTGTLTPTGLNTAAHEGQYVCTVRPARGNWYGVRQQR